MTKTGLTALSWLKLSLYCFVRDLELRKGNAATVIILLVIVLVTTMFRTFTFE